MTRITQSDQIVQLLRQQLQRVAGQKGTARKSRTEKTTDRQSTKGRVEALAALQNLPEDDVERAILRMLLADEIGEAIGNDPKFQAVIEKVHQMIRSDRETKRLLESAIQVLREGEGR